MSSPRLSDHDLISMVLDRVHDWLCKGAEGPWNAQANPEVPWVSCVRDAEQLIFLAINLNAEMGDESPDEPLENLTWTNGRLASELAQRTLERIKQREEDKHDPLQD